MTALNFSLLNLMPSSSLSYLLLHLLDLYLLLPMWKFGPKILWRAIYCQMQSTFLPLGSNYLSHRAQCKWHWSFYFPIVLGYLLLKLSHHAVRKPKMFHGADLQNHLTSYVNKTRSSSPSLYKLPQLSLLNPVTVNDLLFF